MDPPDLGGDGGEIPDRNYGSFFQDDTFVVTHKSLNVNQIVIRGVPILTPPGMLFLLIFMVLCVTRKSGGGPSESAECSDNE